VDAAAIRVEAIAKGDIGAVVLREDGARFFLIKGENRRGRLFEPLDVGRGPGVRRVVDGAGGE